MVCFLLAGLFCVSSYSQVMYPITIEKKGFSKVYYQNDQKLNWTYELNSVLKSNPASVGMINRSIKNVVISGGILLVSIIPWGISLFVMPDDPTTAFILGASALCISLSALPFAIKSDRQRKEAVGLYNKSIPDYNAYRRINVQIGAGPGGVGMYITF